MDEIPNLGMAKDHEVHLKKQRVDSHECQTCVKDARKKLYDEGYTVDGENVDGLLKDESLVPTEVQVQSMLPQDLSNVEYDQNAFLLALAKFGLDIFKILMVDILHELELGVGKCVFIHLVWILESLGPHQIAIFNERYATADPFLTD